MAINRKIIEKRLAKFSKGLTETSGIEKVSQGDSEGKRWRVYNKTQDGFHGYAGGRYFHTLSDVDYWLSLEEERNSN